MALWRDELARQPALAPTIVRDDPQEQLDLLADRSVFPDLGIILTPRHTVDVPLCLGQVGAHNARWGDARGRESRVKALDQRNLGPQRAVKMAPEAQDCTGHGWVRVKLHGVARKAARHRTSWAVTMPRLTT